MSEIALSQQSILAARLEEMHQENLAAINEITQEIRRTKNQLQAQITALKNAQIKLAQAILQPPEPEDHRMDYESLSQISHIYTEK